MYFRLPIVQGSSFTIFIPILAILNLPENQCPADFATEGWGNITIEEKTEEWQKRMRIIQGSVAVASVTQVVLGYCGRASIKAVRVVAFWYYFGQVRLLPKQTGTASGRYGYQSSNGYLNE
jgi:xanthine/uracil permease